MGVYYQWADLWYYYGEDYASAEAFGQQETAGLAPDKDINGNGRIWTSDELDDQIRMVIAAHYAGLRSVDAQPWPDCYVLHYKNISALPWPTSLVDIGAVGNTRVLFRFEAELTAGVVSVDDVLRQLALALQSSYAQRAEGESESAHLFASNVAVVASMALYETRAFYLQLEFLPSAGIAHAWRNNYVPADASQSEAKRVGTSFAEVLQRLKTGLRRYDEQVDHVGEHAVALVVSNAARKGLFMVAPTRTVVSRYSIKELAMRQDDSARHPADVFVNCCEQRALFVGERAWVLRRPTLTAFNPTAEEAAATPGADEVRFVRSIDL